jgi:hypothetical protein
VNTYVWGEPTSVTVYSNGTNDTLITIGASPRDDALEPLQRFAIDTTITPVGADVVAAFPGENLIIGSMTFGSGSMLIAKWHEGDTTITVTSSLPLDELLPLLPTVRPTTASEWTAIQLRVDDVASEPASGAVTAPGPAVAVANGTLAGGAPWVVSISAPGVVTITTDGLFLSYSPLDESMPISAWSSQSATIVTALVDTTSAAQTMVVTVGDQVRATLPLNDLATIDPSSSFGGRVAATAFEQTGPYVVELLDAAGTVVERLASPGADG